MLPTHVIKLPDGTEVGDYIVLDFGGKFFRREVQRPNRRPFFKFSGHPLLDRPLSVRPLLSGFIIGRTLGESLSESCLCEYQESRAYFNNIRKCWRRKRNSKKTKKTDIATFGIFFTIKQLEISWYGGASGRTRRRNWRKSLYGICSLSYEQKDSWFPCWKTLRSHFQGNQEFWSRIGQPDFLDSWSQKPFFSCAPVLWKDSNSKIKICLLFWSILFHVATNLFKMLIWSDGQRESNPKVSL